MRTAKAVYSRGEIIAFQIIFGSCGVAVFVAGACEFGLRYLIGGLFAAMAAVLLGLVFYWMPKATIEVEEEYKSPAYLTTYIKDGSLDGEGRFPNPGKIVWQRDADPLDAVQMHRQGFVVAARTKVGRVKRDTENHLCLSDNI